MFADALCARCSANNREADTRDHLKARIEAVIEETLGYIRNSGGDASLHKCAILASSHQLRAELQRMRRGPKGEQIPVVTDIRDLGAHLSCAKRPRATTLRQRVDEATPIANRVATMRLDTRRRI